MKIGNMCMNCHSYDSEVPAVSASAPLAENSRVGYLLFGMGLN